MAAGSAEDSSSSIDEALPLSRLPAGRHGLPPEVVAENQRERIITALVRVVAERGFNAATVADITKAASVSRRTFYEHFADKEACFLAAYELIVEHIQTSLQAAAEAFEEWPLQVRAALAATLRFLAANPDLARLILIEPIAAGGEVAGRHQASIQQLAEALKRGRPQREIRQPLPATTEPALVGGVLTLIVREVSAGRAAGLEDLLPDVVELVLTPYLGAEAAERVARRG